MFPSDPYGEIQMLLSQLPDSAAKIVAKSREFRGDDEIDFALELLRMAIARDPAPVLRGELVDLLVAEGRALEAVDEALKILGEAPEQPAAQRALRRALIAGLPHTTLRLVEVANELGRLDPVLAEDLLLDAIDEQPADVLLREQLAQFYASQKRIAECIAASQAILDLDPDHDEATLMLAAAHLKEGDLPRAQKLLERARARGCDLPMVQTLEEKVAAVVKLIAEARKP